MGQSVGKKKSWLYETFASVDWVDCIEVPFITHKHTVLTVTVGNFLIVIANIQQGR